jgi:Holliday junction DNA helicase RuvB
VNVFYGGFFSYNVEGKVKREDLLSTEEKGFEGLRPLTFDDFIGQDHVKANLRVCVEAAKQRGEPLDHVLLYGPPGMGKTTLAFVVARELGVNIKVTSGPAIEKIGDLAAILTSLKDGDVLFVDEIHRLGKPVEEALYPAMEEFKFDIILGQGPGAKAIRLKLPRFTLIGATTRIGLLSEPLRARFGMILRLDYYNLEELEKIIIRASESLAIPLDPKGAREIAKRSRGTPRIALRLLKRVRDYAQVKGDGVISSEVARDALDFMQIDQEGLDKMDRIILKTIIEKFGGGPVGIETICAALNEERDTIEEHHEPFLIQMGFLKRTPRGRVVTQKAFAYLGFTPPSGQRELF